MTGFMSVPVTALVAKTPVRMAPTMPPHAVHAERIKGIVPAGPVLQNNSAPEAAHAANKAHDEGGNQTDEARGRRDHDETADGT
jgi:pilL